MSKVKVPIWGTVNKTIFFDPEAGARAEAAVEALAQAISEGIGGTIAHRSLAGLQVGDDHPQYTMWQADETIQGTWNFQTIPYIQGDTLAEYIEDVVGSSTFDFLQDTSSVVWTYHETANELEANVPPEFVQDTVGAMLTDTTSIDLAYNDGAGTFSASIIDEYVQDLVGAMLADSTTIDFTYSDLAGTFTAAVIQSFGYSWSASHTWSDNSEVRLGTGNDLRLYHDGTDSWVRNDTGTLKLSIGANPALQFNSARAFGVDGANYGTSGQVLTSQGSGSPPIWAAGGGGGGGALTFVAEFTVAGSAATTLTATGLDLATDECYELHLHLGNATASTVNIDMYFNGDTTAGNYDRRFTLDLSSSVAANNAFAVFLYPSAAGFYELTMRPDINGRARTIILGNTSTTTSLSNLTAMHVWRTVSNVTSITLSASVANSLAVGSKIVIWKRTT